MASSLSRAQRVALVVGVPLTVAAIGWGGLNAVAAVGRGTEHVSMPIPLHGSSMSVHLGSGDVTVRAASGSTASLTGTVRYSLIKPPVSVSSDQGGTTIGYSCQLPVGWCGLDATLTVPASVTNAQLSTDKGDLTIDGASGLRTLTLSSSMGDIRATGLSAPDVTVRSSMGDVTITFAVAPVSLTVDDSLGDVNIVLPSDGTKYVTHVDTSLGDKRVDVPQDPTSTHVINVQSSLGDVTVTES